ncbi:Crp/Fnr family transcriptional regulator [Kribbella capetownensis]|uniref:Crp/Fnr family transcriptional regulator n=1 Tax=Kribbella capetownensis TaxID=1572659 RepID=A0A4R0JQB3_9ACTN|nr:Crp/Fnr family transcriptional regulator [Kribbella capetownensis]TCC48999.1 Crp/Fnr family transcriptional regulator [Kribbella capetownensis]
MLDWPLLAPLPEPQRRDVLRVCRRRRFARREVIFHEGDPGDCVHLVERGRVAVRVTTPLGDVATLTVLGPGDTFGELSVLDAEAVRSATVVALEHTETWVLHSDQVHRLRAAYPAVDDLLLGLVSGYVRRLTDHLLEALYLAADIRVARRIRALDIAYGGGAIKLTQDDLAGLAGTSRATVNRVLGELVEAGAVRVSRGRVSVTDRTALGRAAG